MAHVKKQGGGALVAIYAVSVSIPPPPTYTHLEQLIHPLFSLSTNMELHPAAAAAFPRCCCCCCCMLFQQLLQCNCNVGCCCHAFGEGGTLLPKERVIFGEGGLLCHDCC